jgi:hypothetical protein
VTRIENPTENRTSASYRATIPGDVDLAMRTNSPSSQCGYRRIE